MSENTDIVDQLRAWASNADEQGVQEVTDGLTFAAAEITRLRADLAQRTAELAALKANDPIAEMWAALAEYQPQADRDGHGESWRIMCEKRTANAAWDAYYSAPSWNKSSGLWSSRAAADAARAANFGNHAKDAIDQIRRAKEAKP